MPNTSKPLSLYLHIPFCQKRCAYCDFNTYAGAENLIPAFVNALCQEIAIAGNGLRTTNVDTIFFGGDTPSLLSIQQFRQIFAAINAAFLVIPNAEISLEANPGTITDGYFEGLREVGFNRISFGVQSADASILKFLDRIHSFEDVRRSVGQAKAAGFDNLNLDLIFGIPGQTLDTWKQTVQAVLALNPQHISAYALGIEEGTPLDMWYRKGLIAPVDDDLAADQFELAGSLLQQAGYDHYEISNWSMPGRECRHNLAYWRNLNYLGLGPGAHGHYNGLRYANLLAIPPYIKAFQGPIERQVPPPCSPAVAQYAQNNADAELEDKLMCGLRLLKEGVNVQKLETEFQIDFAARYKRQLAKLATFGLIEHQGNQLRLSKKGVFLGNQVFREFIGS